MYSRTEAVIQCGYYADPPTTAEERSLVNRINDFWKPFYFRHAELTLTYNPHPYPYPHPHPLTLTLTRTLALTLTLTLLTTLTRHVAAF